MCWFKWPSNNSVRVLLFFPCSLCDMDANFTHSFLFPKKIRVRDGHYLPLMPDFFSCIPFVNFCWVNLCKEAFCPRFSASSGHQMSTVLRMNLNHPHPESQQLRALQVVLTTFRLCYNPLAHSGTPLQLIPFSVLKARCKRETVFSTHWKIH